MRAFLVRLARRLSRCPATAAVAVSAGLALAVGAPLVAEPQFAGPGPSALAACFVVLSFAVCEHLVGTTRSLIVATVASAVAVLCGWAAVSVGSSLDDVLGIAPDAVWASSIPGVAVLLAASARLRGGLRRALRWIVLVPVITMVLYDGHASDLARLVAAAVGLGIGAAITRGHDAAEWGTSRQARLRRVVTAALVVMGAGAVLTILLPDANGLLAPFGYLNGPFVSVMLGSLLLVSAGSLLTGRRAGIVIAVAAELAIVTIVGFAYVVAPPNDGWDPGATLSWDDLAWIAVCALPSSIAILLVAAAGRLTRRRAPTATANDRERVADLVRGGTGGSLSYMATWAGNSYWFAPDGTAAIAYRVSRGFAFTVSDPIVSAPDLEATVRAFSAHCERMGWVPVLYSVHDDTADLADRLGWAKTPVGTEAVIDLATFSLSGKRRQDLRTATNRAGREGVAAVWTTFGDLTAAHRAQVEAVCRGWAGQRRLPEMGFTLGGIGELDDDAVRLMLAVGPDDTVLAVTSWLPAYRAGELIGWTLDVMRRAQTAMPGVMEFLIATVALRSREAGLTQVSLSGTPLAPHGKTPTTILDRLVARLAHLLEPAYGFGSLRSFKNKFEPARQRLWMIYPSGLHLGRIGPALATTYAPGLSPRDLIHVVRPATRSLPVAAHRDRSLA